MTASKSLANQRLSLLKTNGSGRPHPVPPLLHPAQQLIRLPRAVLVVIVVRFLQKIWSGLKHY